MREQDAKAHAARLKNSKVPTAYLSQQISQLQEKVGAVSLNGARSWPAPANGNVDEYEFPPLGAEPLPKRDQSREPARDEVVRIEARIDDSGVESVDAEDKGYGSGHGRRRGRQTGQNRRERRERREADQPESSADEDVGEREWRVVVLDTSALLWAPQGVRGLVRQGLEVIVPAEALRTLDLLKSGSSPSARAARSAARWIEHSSKHYKAASGQHKHGRGLRIQQDSETSPPDSISSLPIPVIDGDVLPMWMEAILGCAAYFIASMNADGSDAASIASISESGPTLCVANPPLSVEVEEGFTGNIGQRGEGYLISQEAERYEIPIEVLRDDEEDLDEPKRKTPQRGKAKNGARGRGGGRNGGNRAKEDSPEREVKILLRRPEAEDAAGSLIPAPQLSSPSSAHRSPLAEPPRVEGPAPPRSPRLPPAFVPRDPSSPRPSTNHPQPIPPPSPRGRIGTHGPSRPMHDHDRNGVPPPRDGTQRRPAQELYDPRGPRDRSEHGEKPGRGRGGARGGRGAGAGRGGRGGGRGGRGGAGGGSGHGPVSGEFVLLQRPGPPPVEERMGGGSSGPKVVLLQRPK